MGTDHLCLVNQFQTAAKFCACFMGKEYVLPGNPVCPILGNKSKIIACSRRKTLSLLGHPVCPILSDSSKMMVMLLGKIILSNNPVCPILDLFHGERLSMPSYLVYPILGNRNKMLCVVFFGKIIFVR